MASQLTVDNIVGATTSDRIHIPGHIIQVVQASATSAIQKNSTSFVATGFSASITPTSTSSKILVMGSIPVYLQNTSSGSHGIVTVYRGGVASGTDISTSPTAFGLAQNYTAGQEQITMANFHKLDSPSTTSTTPYEVAVRMFGSLTHVWIGTNQDNYTLTLMEIAQ